MIDTIINAITNFFTLKVIAISVTIYFIPTIISLFFKSRTIGIFFFNLFFGWTIIGWISALFEAFIDRKADRYGFESMSDEEFEDLLRSKQVMEADRRNKKEIAKELKKQKKALERTAKINNRKHMPHPNIINTTHRSNETDSDAYIECSVDSGPWLRDGISLTCGSNLNKSMTSSFDRLTKKYPGRTVRVRAIGKTTGKLYDIR